MPLHRTRDEVEAQIERTVAGLESNYKIAHLCDRLTDVQPLAFPKGMTRQLDENGRTIALGANPDDGAHVESLVEQANTCPLAFDAALARASYTLRGDEALPACLRIFLAEYLVGNRPRPKASPGRKRAEVANYTKYQVLCSEIRRLVGEGYSATRSEEPANQREDSACDILARAMARLGLIPRSYSHLVDIWAKRNDLY